MKRFSAVLPFSILSLAVLCAEQQKPKREFQLQPDSDDFWRLFDRESKLATLASGFGFTEGPVWDREGFLIVSDEVRDKILRVSNDGRKEELVSVGDPDGNTYDRQQRLIDCASGAVLTRSI